MRTHIVLPDDLVAEIDTIVGPRKRSLFIEEAVRAKLQRERLRRAMEAVKNGPGLDPEKYPYWSTPQKTSEWVHNMRVEDDKLRPSPWERYQRN
jgi:hypothetical protein